MLQYATLALSEHQSDTSASQMQTGAQTGVIPGLVCFLCPAGQRLDENAYS